MRARGVDGIAIVGMAGRFPGAQSLDQFWTNLRDGVESIAHFSTEELLAAGIDPAIVRHPHYVRAKGALADIDMFDAAFFGFSPREATLTDPQHRLFLECCWEALENAGYSPSGHGGTTGVYAGAGLNTYLLSNLMTSGAASDPLHALQISIHNKSDHLSTRVAYKLNLRGPAITVQTACSTSLVAVCLACHSLLSYQNDMALAGGVNISVPRIGGYFHQEGGTASPDGHCRAFDARARGTVEGNGVGVVVLKRLEDALADGDHVLAVIRGVAMNNDGGHKQGYTAPGANSQAEVIAMALAMAGLTADEISYVEAHGTGTVLGDPIEVAALVQAFDGTRRTRPPCALGSVKTNIGHLDAAAGIAGLIKTVLALQHRVIPPSLHFETANPQIDFDRSGFRVHTSAAEWTTSEAPRRAGVSSFGIGGTNAHVILEEAPAVSAREVIDDWQVLPLSASATALERATDNLAAHLSRHPELHLGDVAYTLQVGRAVFPQRRIALCRNPEDAVHSLSTLTPSRVVSRQQQPIHRPIVFAFPGQGSQYVGMGAALSRSQSTFRRELERCAEILSPHLPAPLLGVIYAEAKHPGAAELLDRTEFTQPALFAIEFALARWWMDLGVKPQAMLGHSIGEYVAACLSGVIRLEDALSVVAFRGRRMQSLPEGVMLAVPLSERDLAPLLDDDMSLAAVNGPTQCVVAGPRVAAERCEAVLMGRGLSVRRLPASRAFHSAMTDSAAAELTEFLQHVPLRAPEIPFVSNVTGRWISAEEATSPAYWGRHLRHTVRFAEGLDEVLRIGDALLIEVGPGRTVHTLARWHPAKSPTQVVLTSLPARDAANEEVPQYLRAVGEAWLAGVEVDWRKLHDGASRRRVPLPTYHFERRRFWIAPGGRHAPLDDTSPATTLDDWFYVPVWKPAPFAAAPAADNGGRRWLVLADRSGFAGRLIESLRTQGALVTTVVQGGEYRELDADRYAVEPTRRADYEQLCRALSSRGALPEFVVHAWTVDDGVGQRAALDAGFYSVIALTQALGARSATTRALCIVSTRTQKVLEEDEIDPLKAAVLGLARVIPQEYDTWRCQSVDLAPSDLATRDEQDAIHALVNDQLNGGHAIQAWRKGERWSQEFVRTHVPSLAPRTAANDPGVYVITGGFGGIAGHIARHLARTRRARIVLVGRGSVPARHAWDEYLAGAAADDDVSKRIGQIQRLEALGAEVLPIAADVSDRDAMAAAVAESVRRFGRINGVIHAAGVAGGGLIQWRDPDAIAAVLAPKVTGTRVLEQWLEHLTPDFVVLASSLASVVGRPGQADYAAANAFLDAFATQFAARTGIYTVSINWPEWRDTGMAAQVVAAGGSRDLPPRHPLLAGRVIAPDGVETYTTRFRVSAQWVLDEHRLVGTAVIPGTAFIEMVRAALADRAAGRAIEIRDLYFLAPLRVGNDETREVSLVMIPDGEGFEFAIESDAIDADGRSGVGRYATGHARVIADSPPPPVDLAAVRARCPRREVPREEDREDDLGPRWQNVVVSHVGSDEVLVQLELADAFAADIETFHYHPALMDRATGRAQEHLAAGAFLPVSYRRLRIYGRVPRAINSHARLRRGLDPSEETLTFDTRIADSTGRTLVEVDGFMQRRINDPGAAIKAFATQAAPTRARPVPSRPPGISPDDGVAALDRILAARIGPRVAVAPYDLAADLARGGADAQRQALDGVSRIATRHIDRHARPSLDSEYREPRTDVERVLAAAWEDGLGVAPVGVDDNFFALGGDSVQAIQIIAHLAQRGVRLSPQQFFQHQTIADIADALSIAQTDAAPNSGEPQPVVADAGVALAGLDEHGLQQLSALIEEADAS